jgi:transcriptional regulator with XRE-family HTH domain
MMSKKAVHFLDGVFPDAPNELARKLILARRDKNLSQCKTAKLAGISKSSLWSLENEDRNKVLAMTIFKLARVLGVTVDYLLDDSIPSFGLDGETTAAMTNCRALSIDSRRLVHDFIKLLEEKDFWRR